jgi:Tfp pilus assembly protein FimT
MEMLAALAVAATLTSFVAISLAGTRQDRALDTAITQLSSDLRAARTEARRMGEAVGVRWSETGYTIEALGRAQSWPQGVSAQWELAAPDPAQPDDSFSFTAQRLSQAGLVITLQDDAGAVQLEVNAITGRINGA